MFSFIDSGRYNKSGLYYLKFENLKHLNLLLYISLDKNDLIFL